MLTVTVDVMYYFDPSAWLVFLAYRLRFACTVPCVHLLLRKLLVVYYFDPSAWLVFLAYRLRFACRENGNATWCTLTRVVLVGTPVGCLLAYNGCSLQSQAGTVGLI